MNEREQSDQNSSPQRDATGTSIHLVVNWTHMSVFVAVAALGLITLNQRFDGLDQRFDDMSQRINRLDSRLGRVETRLDRVEGTLTDIIARLSVVEFIVRARADAEAESPSVPEDSPPDC